MDLIYVEKNSLSEDFCKTLIEIFNKDEDRYQGVTLSKRVNLKVKNTTDLKINVNKSEWKEIDDALYNELHKHLNIYFDRLGLIYNQFSNITDMGFHIQHYKKHEGQYIYHNDFNVDYTEKKYRFLTFMWYLNDVEEGGETEFFGKYKIKPEVGKIVLFPASWTYPHCGLVPRSGDKYIVTGWVYQVD